MMVKIARIQSVSSNVQTTDVKGGRLKKSMFNTSFSRRELQSIYDPLRYSFLVLGIDIFGEDKKLRAVRTIMAAAFHATSFIAFVTEILMFGFFLDGFTHDVLASILLLFFGNALRCLLYTKRKYLVNLLTVLTKNKMKADGNCTLKNVRRKYCCIGVIFISTMVGLVTFIAPSLTESLKYVISESPKWQSVLKSIHREADTVFAVAYIYSFLSCSCLTLGVSHIFYGLVSWHLKAILSYSKHSVIAAPFSFKLNHQIYSRVRILVESFDSQMEFNTGFAVLNLSTIMYYVLFPALNAHSQHAGFKLAVILILILVLASVAIVILEAGSIPIVNQQILSAVNQIPLENDTSVTLRICLIHQIQQGLYLTIGGMVPITNSLFLVVIGTTLSYSLLIRAFF